MINKIVLNGKELEYELEYKNIRSISLRIKQDGRIFVSANKSVKISVIEEFMHSKAKAILNALEKCKKTDVKSCNITDGGKVYILGEEKTVVIKEGRMGSAVLDKDKIVVTVRRPEDARKVFDTYLEDECKKIVVRLCEKVYPYYKSKGIEYPEIQLKKRKSIWGSCNNTKGVLTFNTALLFTPVECIEYVVLHEFTHFLVPNHSKAFYRELEIVCPDWKRYRDEMKKYII